MKISDAMRWTESLGFISLGLCMLLLSGCQFDGRQMVAAMSEALGQSLKTEEVDPIVPVPDNERVVGSASGESSLDEEKPLSEAAKLPGLDSEIDVEASSVLISDDVTQQIGKNLRPPWNSPYEVYGDRYDVKGTSRGYREVGIASWYGEKFQGRKTSNGEIFDMHALSAAHKTLPIPTMIRVTNLDNGKKIDVRVNDRGPFHDDRILDLSFAAAKALGFSDQGTAPVVVEALDAINYPDEIVGPKKSPNVYLQAGAFQSIDSAKKLKRDIETTLMLQRLNADVRVLESELEAEVKLHKVWVGPIINIGREEMIMTILSQMGLSQPVRVVAD